MTGSELWRRRPVVLVFTASYCERCREIHRAAAEAVDGRDDAVALLGIAGTDDADAADYAEELDLGHPLAVAPERVWLSYAAREPGLAVLVGQDGKVVRGRAPGRDGCRARARPRRALRRVTRVAVLAALALAAACGGDSGIDAELRIVVPDNNIREEGVECAGARPFRAIHRGTGYSIEDPAGEVVADGELARGASRERRPERRLGVERSRPCASSASRSTCRSGRATGSSCRTRCRSSSSAGFSVRSPWVARAVGLGAGDSQPSVVSSNLIRPFPGCPLTRALETVSYGHKHRLEGGRQDVFTYVGLIKLTPEGREQLTKAPGVPRVVPHDHRGRGWDTRADVRDHGSVGLLRDRHTLTTRPRSACSRRSGCSTSSPPRPSSPRRSRSS